MDNFEPGGWTPPGKNAAEGTSEAAPGTPLDKYSITFRTDELERMAEEQYPLLGEFGLKNQTTALYAKPNTGKTVLLLHAMCEAVKDGRIDGGKCYYVDADDNPSGILEKIKLLQPYRINVLAPGLHDFEINRLPALLRAMADDGTARGCLVVIDTLKKVVNLMDKRDSSEFANLCRAFIMAGGTIAAAAHTNKRTDSDGRPIYSGTSDMVDDIDCSYTIQEVSRTGSQGEKLVQLRNIKRRGGNPEEIAYSYSNATGISYEQLFRSVRRQTDEDLERAKAEAEREKDADVVETVVDCISAGITSKMELSAEVAKRLRNVGRNKVGVIIDRYTGDDPAKHRWTFQIVERGKRIYRLLPFDGSDGREVDPDTIF